MCFHELFVQDGVYGYIRSIDDIVDDFSRFLLDIKQLPRYVNIPLFLYGESMGGKVTAALLLCCIVISVS
jgi:alpha-beta hydrolase superfamily lysophospholipase